MQNRLFSLGMEDGCGGGCNGSGIQLLDRMYGCLGPEGETDPECGDGTGIERLCQQHASGGIPGRRQGSGAFVCLCGLFRHRREVYHIYGRGGKRALGDQPEWERGDTCLRGNRQFRHCVGGERICSGGA